MVLVKRWHLESLITLQVFWSHLINSLSGENIHTWGFNQEGHLQTALASQALFQRIPPFPSWGGWENEKSRTSQ